jgi:hypothetical protein
LRNQERLQRKREREEIEQEMKRREKERGVCIVFMFCIWFQMAVLEAEEEGASKFQNDDEDDEKSGDDDEEGEEGNVHPRSRMRFDASLDQGQQNKKDDLVIAPSAVDAFFVQRKVGEFIADHTTSLSMGLF